MASNNTNRNITIVTAIRSTCAVLPTDVVTSVARIAMIVLCARYLCFACLTARTTSLETCVCCLSTIWATCNTNNNNNNNNNKCKQQQQQMVLIQYEDNRRMLRRQRYISINVATSFVQLCGRICKTQSRIWSATEWLRPALDQLSRPTGCIPCIIRYDTASSLVGFEHARSNTLHKPEVRCSS